MANSKMTRGVMIFWLTCYEDIDEYWQDEYEMDDEQAAEIREIGDRIVEKMEFTALPETHEQCSKELLEIRDEYANWMNNHLQSREAESWVDEEVLKKWRLNRKLTQAQAADLVGVTRRAWQSWELADRPIPNWLPRMIKRLGGNK